MPLGIAVTGGYGQFNECHSPYRLIDARAIRRTFIWLFARRPGPDLPGKGHIDIGKGFEVTFRVPHGRAGIGRGQFTEVAAAGAEHFGGAIGPFQPECVGLLLGPLKATLFTIDANTQGIFFADTDLA